MAGMSRAKGRRNAKSKRGKTYQAFPAKAGRRKIYGKVRKDSNGNVLSGQPKTKSFQPDERYVMRSEPQPDGMVCAARWKTGQPAMVTRLS